ncbi:MAG: hypothetical protein A3B13_03695 [Candidatus Liptonbacteria bacterium RIFCSPLOWO2_01_FULL_45_15]|uniref:Uncharacterized protein n=1 Tax=Candidatus Liptonbacteria bacterium RIFCSPLOWO2_01_FULL_45_15 TaxID=1798649 RepID=A0A1G2CIF8_9BACT|nr:MAG: hypothetical protein A3B13_03695 [Candidatus Liptonbacteria bacterium RIFCSPLOWO2_01_FULL_45_15]
MNPETKICQNCKQNFVIEQEDFDFYKKMSVPPPTFCPECRMIRRLSFRNQQKLFRAKEAVSGKEIFSMYSPEAGLKIYEDRYWLSDNWDAMEYGRDYDFSRPFFEQFRELMLDVPWDAVSVLRMVNSDYSNNASDFKNCYLCFNGSRNEDSAYCIGFSDSKNSFECKQADHLELCYELFSSSSCYKTFWSAETDDSQNVWFCKSCNNLSDCFGCVNLKSKQYHIFNKPYSKEDYKEKIEEMRLNTYSGLMKARDDAYKFWKQFPVKYMRSIMNVNVDGEFIFDSKNVHRSYHIGNVENVKYSFNVFDRAADCYDYCSWGEGVQMIYECLIVGEGAKNLKFCYECWPSSQNMEYCAHCRASSDCFGCFGIKKKQYCIFNKQYSKEEYFSLKDKIIKHMNEMPYTDKKGNIYRYGEFFPSDFSPFAINETIAGDYFPIGKENANSMGFIWREPNLREFQITMKAGDLPDSIADTNEAICKETIGCVKCGRAYRIIPMEFQFYKLVGMPLPRKCHECRLRERIEKFMPPMKWYPMQCMCDYAIYKNFSQHNNHPSGQCSNKFLTTHVPGNGEIVYCEQCYNSEVA